MTFKLPISGGICSPRGRPVRREPLAYGGGPLFQQGAGPKTAWDAGPRGTGAVE